MVGDLAGLQKGLPLDSLAEELDYPGCHGVSGRFWLSPRRRHGSNYPLRRHPARQDADVAIFEDSLGPQGNLDPLFVAGRHGAAVLALQGDVDDTEPDLRFGDPQAGSNTVTLKEP